MRTPAPLGADFRKLWAASAVSNLGDGVTLVAGPLLMASLTRDPAAVAGAAFAQQLPWLLFSLVSGVYADRMDRRRLIVGANLARAAALGALALTIAAGAVTVPLVYAVLFVLGTGETIADTAAAAHLPRIVPAERLTSANTRLMATFTLGNQFLAKPLGAFLFVTAAALPFGFDALTFATAALLVATMRPDRDRPVPPRARLREDVATGLRALWGDALLRTLAVAMGAANVVLCAAFAVLVLYAGDRLGLTEMGYGVLLVTFAAGGLLGTAVTGRLRARFGAPALLRAGLVVETATHLGLAVTTHPWPAAVILTAFGAHSMIWGAIATTAIQRAAPAHLLGRVSGAYGLTLTSGAAVGSLLGGVLARELTLTAPFWLAALTMAAITAISWRGLSAAR
ncbi:MFS transporter [Bailinhaonella thermotolerans]|uniref:MFS transporter n=1 Tax=Bailinhaonella thermotolerans TaxID=1070861 RepID=A0A3A4AVF6_9ACTN|nr:MFS transporter [Bailinhaonella thermotolerans]